MKNITFQNDTYSIPFNLTCTVSGLTKVYTSEEYINGKLVRFGGLEKLKATYICRDAQKMLKKGKTPDEVRAHFATAAVETPSVPVTEQPVTPVVETPTIVETVPAVVVPTELPIAKKDKNGKYRNAKGHLISEFNLKNFRIVEDEKVAAVA